MTQTQRVTLVFWAWPVVPRQASLRIVLLCPPQGLRLRTERAPQTAAATGLLEPLRRGLEPHHTAGSLRQLGCLVSTGVLSAYGQPVCTYDVDVAAFFTTTALAPICPERTQMAACCFLYAEDG